MALEGRGRAEVLAWQRKARRRFSQRLGLDRFQQCPPQPVHIASVLMDGYRREEWRIQTERDVWMPFSILVPDGLDAPAPVVLCPHGHSSGGKWATAGRRDIPVIQKVIEHYNYDYGVQIARAGFITVCPDARGFGERREPAQQDDPADAGRVLASSCHVLTLAGTPLGLTVQGMWTWDLMRLVDWLCTQKRVDASRIGCAGLSGGGAQALNLTAVDKRIRATVNSGYFYGVRESLQIMNMNCMCNLVPGLWEDFDLGDIGALLAPRGLFIETGASDELNGQSGLKNVRTQVAISRRAYSALDAPRQIQHHVFDGGHRWDGTKAIPWLKQQLQSA